MPNTHTAVELKPCPLCNNPAEIDRYSPFRHYRTGEPLDQVSVYCTSCSLNLSWYPGDLDLDRDQTAEFVVESWNVRHRIASTRTVDTELLDALKAAKRREVELVDALDGIYIYANDTLSGRADGPDDRKWQRDGIVEIRNRARKFATAQSAIEARAAITKAEAGS